MPDTPFRNIVVPVDFSELSGRALQYAAALLRCSGAKVSAIYASTFLPPPYFTPGRVMELERQYRDSLEDARRGLDAFIAARLGEAPWLNRSVVEGLPADTIARVATGAHADLIVMGTHGRSGVNRWKLGSVAEHVLRESRIPVLTVRQEGPPPGPVAIRNILCPVNDSPIAREALRTASNLAACLGATLTVLHVNEPGGKLIPDLCAWVAEQDRAHCQVRELVRHGEAAEQIVSAAAEEGCDLAVIGARHRPFFDSTVLGTTTIRVVRHARCPVLTVSSRSEDAGAQPAKASSN